MKTLQKLFYVACTVFFFASCEETYNDKLFWPGEISQEYGSYIKPYALDLTYSGEKLIGKTVSFKTENSETGTLTLNDVIPGEAETPIQISLCEKEDSYSFDGVATSLTGATIKYSGAITPKNLKLVLDVKMADPDGLANAYSFGTYDMIDNSDAFQYIIFKGSCYFSIIPQENVDINNAPMLYMMSVIGSSALQIAVPQLIKDIKLEENGNVTAKFSSDPIDVEQLLTLALNGTSENEIQQLVRKRTYQSAPNGLAQWNKVNDKFILKLNIPAIINEVIKNSQQEIDSKLIGGITEAIFKADPIRLKGLLGTLNALVNNDVLGYLVKTDDATFSALFSCIKSGIPMNISHTEDGHTYLYLDYQTLTPIINVVSGIKVDAMGLTIDLALIAQEWKLMQTVNLGLDLVPEQNNQQ